VAAQVRAVGLIKAGIRIRKGFLPKYHINNVYIIGTFNFGVKYLTSDPGFNV